MTNAENLLFRLSDGILTVTINREYALNALNKKTMLELRSTFNEVDQDDSIRGVILTGQGEKAFVAGADIKELAEVNELSARKIAEEGQEIFESVERLMKPVIAVVNGYALGGGCELSMACHMRIATKNAKFGLPEVTLGVIPGYGGTQRLTRLIGSGRAMEMILTGNVISAAEAEKIGLVNHVFDSKEKALQQANEILAAIYDRAPLAVGEAIQCINASQSHLQVGFQTEANAFARLCLTEDFKEGTAAFVEKRKPNFTGK